MKELKAEREELVQHIDSLRKIDAAHPNLQEEYREQLTREIAFKTKVLESIDAKILLTGVKEIDNRVSRRANKNR